MEKVENTDIKRLQEFMENIDLLRERFHKVLLKRPMSPILLSVELDIHHHTLRSFLFQNKKVKYKTLYKISQYVIRQEKKLGIK